MRAIHFANVRTPLLAATDCLLLAGREFDRAEEAKLEAEAINRIRHAADNLGFDLVEKKTARKEAA